MFWIVLVLIVASAMLAMVLYNLFILIAGALSLTVRPNAYMVAVPLIALVISAILGTVLSIVIDRRYLRPLSQLLDATRAVADGDFTVRVQPPPQHDGLAAYIDSFNKMAEELSSLEILRTDFVNTFSHEFKTPIISIRGFARLLQSDRLTPGQKKLYTDTIIRESERLADMSTNILLLSQYENTEIISGKVTYDLDEQIRRCIQLQERSWLDKEITMVGELEPVSFFGQEDIVAHIWTNLIANAVRFTPAGGQVIVTLRGEEEQVVVTIADTGIGMDEDTQRRIFDKFYKADASAQSSGNGLGLAIVRRVVDLCGGTIGVRSRPGEGSVFTVTLPRQ
jgi:signal transduction histidine kinase